MIIFVHNYIDIYIYLSKNQDEHFFWLSKVDFLSWKYANPNGTVKECMKETGLARANNVNIKFTNLGILIFTNLDHLIYLYLFLQVFQYILRPI